MQPAFLLQILDYINISMKLSFTFPPDASRARAIDRRMRLNHANSMAYLVKALREQLDVNLPEVEILIEACKRGAIYPPTTFGLYYEIATALLNDNYQQAMALFNELIQERPIASGVLNVVTLDKITPTSNLLRYQRLMDTDLTVPFRIIPPPADEAYEIVAKFQSAFKRMQQAIPMLAEEFEAIIREVILVTGDKQNGYDFAGGSSYMLWGALFVNVSQHATDIALIEAMAHESAHSLLFGFTVDEVLVKNPVDECYASPLRDDPRPMDGIFHATFVSARMHWAMSKLIESSQLSHVEIELVAALREIDRNNFWSGYSTVRNFAKLTETGRKLMDSACGYMSQREAGKL